MKKVVFAGWMVFFFGLNVAYAQFWKQSTPKESKPLVSTEKIVTRQVVTAAPGGQAGAVDKKKAELNGTEWTVTMTSAGAMAKGKAKGSEDVITFSDGKVGSKNLKNDGFEPSNFSVRFLDDGTTVWETMQSSEKAGLAFWRGDIGPDGIMRGVLSKRDKAEKTTDFDFVSTGSQKAAAIVVPAVKEVPAAKEAPVTE